MPSFEKVDLRDVYDEIETFLRNQAEEDNEPFQMDMDLLLTYNDNGFRRQYIARDEDRIVGHCAIYFSDNTRSGVPTAQEETWYLLPEYRKGWTALKLWKFIEEDLKKDGMKKITMTIDPKSRIKSLLTFADFTVANITYEKHYE